jgi:hypothetical protein
VRVPGGWLPLLILLAACGTEPPPAPPPADAVATWDGGALTFAEVESELGQSRSRTCRRARRAGGVEDLVPCYRELAESQALERLVLAEVDDLDAALEGLADYPQLRRHAFVETWLSRVRDEIEITDAEVEARFDADPGRYRRPGTVLLSNIFRRHQDPARPQDTVAFLRTLKKRFEAGETFDALARQYSQSETRSRGGEVGRVSEDRLPERLRRVVFALEEGEVSDPVRVRGGAVLLYARTSSPAVEPTLAEADRRIRRDLLAERIEAAVSSRVAGREPPAGSRIFELEALIEALDGDDSELPVLEIEGDRLTAADLRRLAGLGDGRASDLGDVERDRLAELYFHEKERLLLGLDLVDTADPEIREDAAGHLRREAVARLVDERLRADMRRRIDEPTLTGYFEDNRHHYQSPLRFALRIWNLPFGDDPPGQLRRMEALHERLSAGDAGLEDAAAELGGEVEDLGWRDFEELAGSLPGKAATYLMEVAPGGFSVPYQQGDALHVLELVERREPAPLEYADAAEQVRDDYLVRFQQDLYRQVADQRLGAAGYAFDEAAVRRLLAPPAEPS